MGVISPSPPLAVAIRGGEGVGGEFPKPSVCIIEAMGHGRDDGFRGGGIVV